MMVKVRCVPGDVHEYSLVPVVTQFQGQKHRIKSMVNPRRTHPLILGMNCLGAWGARDDDISCASRRHGGWGHHGDMEGGEGSHPPSHQHFVGISHRDFPLEQSPDETLRLLQPSINN